MSCQSMAWSLSSLCNPTTATHITITDLCSSFSLPLLLSSLFSCCTLCALRLLISSVAVSIVHVIVTNDHVWNAKCDNGLFCRFQMSWIPAREYAPENAYSCSRSGERSRDRLRDRFRDRSRAPASSYRPAESFRSFIRGRRLKNFA